MDKVGIKIYYSDFFFVSIELWFWTYFTAEEYGKNLEASQAIPEMFVPQITLD